MYPIIIAIIITGGGGQKKQYSLAFFEKRKLSRIIYLNEAIVHETKKKSLFFKYATCRKFAYKRNMQITNVHSLSNKARYDLSIVFDIIMHNINKTKE